MSERLGRQFRERTHIPAGPALTPHASPSVQPSRRALLAGARCRLVREQAHTHEGDSASTGRTAVPTVPRNASVFFADLREQHIVGRLVTMRTEA